MDAKTFENMNDKVTRYSEAQIKIDRLSDRIAEIVKCGIVSVSCTFTGDYTLSIPHLDEEVLKETLIKLMSDKIEALEKEQSEI